MKQCPKTGSTCHSSACVLDCLMNSITSYTFPLPPKFAYIPLDELRSIYSGLGRAIESGDPLQIGLILGQVYKQLEQYVNTDTTGDHSFTVSVNTKGSAIQSGITFGPGSTFGGKTPDISPDTE